MNVRHKSILASALLGAVTILAIQPALAKEKPSISRKENSLLAAGFEVRPANTPERQEMLSRLPKRTFVRNVQGDNVAYVYADPAGCNCLYVGTQQAYGTYQRDKQDARIAQQQEFAAQAYQDDRWNWGAWGPWGDSWGPWGFGWRHGW